MLNQLRQRIPSGLKSARHLVAHKATLNGTGLLWWLLRWRLKASLSRGDVVVVIGETGTGKTRLLEHLVPGNVLNFFENGVPAAAFAPAYDAFTGEIVARCSSVLAFIPEQKIPNVPFGVDECGYHHRDDVSRALNKTPGCALVFQDWSQVDHYQLEDLVRHRNVTVLEIVRTKEMAEAVTLQRRMKAVAFEEFVGREH